MSAEMESSSPVMTTSNGSMPTSTITDSSVAAAKVSTTMVGVKSSLSLPPRARRSQSTASLSAAALNSNFTKSIYPPLVIHNTHTCTDNDTHSLLDSFTSSDVETTPRVQLRRAITEYKHSLTVSEFSFLKELVSTGTETHIQSALETLKDDSLFSPPSPPDKNTNNNGALSHCNSKGVGIQTDDTSDSKKINNSIYATPLLVHVSLPTLDDTGQQQTDQQPPHVNSMTTTTTIMIKNKDSNTPTIEDNPFITALPNTTQLISGSGEDSVELLERYKISIQEKERHHHDKNHPQEDILPLHSAFDLDKPIELVNHNRTYSFGSEARGAHIEKRIASTVHGHLWKAHESGISLHSIPCSTHQHQPLRPSSPAMIHRTDVLKRSNSVMSSSTMDLVEYGGPYACTLLDTIFRTYSPPRQRLLERKGILSTDDGIGNINTNNTIVASSFPVTGSTIVSPTTTTTTTTTTTQPPPPHLTLRNNYRSHSRSNSIVSTSSSIGSSHFDWPPSNFETIFRERMMNVMQQQQQYSRSPFMNKKLLQLNGNNNMDTNNNTPNRLKNLPPIHQHIRRNSSSARSVSSIPSLHRASLIRSHSMASSIASADNQQTSSTTTTTLEMDGLGTSSIYNVPPRGHKRLDSDRSSIDNGGSFPILRRANSLRANSVVSSIVPLEQLKDDEFNEFAKRWLTGDVETSFQNSVPKVYDAPSTDKMTVEKRPSKIRNLQHQIIMKDASDGTDDGIELELQMLDFARSKMRSRLDSSGDESFLSRSSMNSYESNRQMYTQSLIDRMSSVGERSTSISYPFWTPSIAKESESIHHPIHETIIGQEVESSSWDLHSEGDAAHYNAWDVLIDEYSVGYGFRDLPFQILGTSANDTSAKPHVLSPPLMESLSYFFPDSVANENWWLKYSLIRDGASMYTMLQRIRGSTHTLIAIETVDGEVFGSYTSKPWRKSLNFFGSGESFLWKMRKTRKTPCQSVIDQAQLESEIEVYPWTGCNNCVQICNSQNLIVGGGAALEDRSDGLNTSDLQANDGMEYGLGLVIEGKAMLYGTSSQCATFNNAPLSIEHSDGSPFEIANLEVWTFSPANSVELAERLELGSLFLESNTYSKQ